MYKYLLCWRYLRTRYIALASITYKSVVGSAFLFVCTPLPASLPDDTLHHVTQKGSPP